MYSSDDTEYDRITRSPQKKTLCVLKSFYRGTKNQMKGGFVGGLLSIKSFSRVLILNLII